MFVRVEGGFGWVGRGQVRKVKKDAAEMMEGQC